MIIPFRGSTTISGVRVLVSNMVDPQTDSITLDSTNTDTGSTPNHRFRPGNVVVYKTSAKTYVEANDATGDANTQATVSSSEAADSDWKSKTITLTVDGVDEVTVSLGAGDDTTSEVVTALNANATFAALAIASGNDGAVVVTKLRMPGKHSLKMTSDLSTAYGASGTEDTGTEADFRVTLDYADLKDEEGTAMAADVIAARSGHFDASNLVNLTAAARAVLGRRGAIFDDE